MEKLVKLNGRWNIESKSDVWQGTAILTDDGWFEGIVVDPNSTYKGNRLVFGCYILEKRIEMLKLTPTIVSDPLIFRVWGKKNAKYTGAIYVAGNVLEIKIGTVVIDIEELHEIDMTELKSKIQLYKDVMDHKNRIFYNNVNDVRDMIIDLITLEVEDPLY